MNRILCSPDEVDDAGMALLADRRADHILRVLRAAPGQVLRAGILDGPAADATVMTMDGGTVRIQLSAYGPAPARARVDLLLALPRPKVLKRLLPQLAALGIDRLILANARKVERYYFDSHVLAPEFCHAQFVEGLQQAGHTRLPRVSIHRRLKILIEDELDSLSDAGLRCLLHPPARERLVDMLTDSPTSRVLLALGPEGGWTDHELTLLQDHRFHPLRLGTRILRSDTACVSAVAMAAELIAA